MKLANPYKTKAITLARINTDKLTARILVHLLWTGQIAECLVSSKDVRRIIDLLIQRIFLVRIRTMVKSWVQALLDRYGYRPKWRNTFSVQGMRWLRGLEMNPIDQCLLGTNLRYLECLNDEREFLASLIAQQATESGDAARAWLPPWPRSV